MPFELLREIEQMKLPIDVKDPERVDRVRILYAAGLVEALVPSSMHSTLTPTCAAPARILSITPKGKKALALQLDDDLL